MTAPARSRLPLVILFLGIVTLMLVYSQTRSFAWDEGYHVLAAMLIKSGKRMYLDFCFPQTPLNTYWNAFWMTLFGESWRPLHVVAALCCAFAAWLAAGFVRARFPVAKWRDAAAIAVLFTVGLNVLIIQWGSVAQAYALTVILLVTAFRLTIAAVEREGPVLAAVAGLAAGCAASATLLSAPGGPVLLLWILVYNRAGSRWVKAASLVAGEALAFVPLLRLFLLDPRRVWFNIFEYQFYFRKVEWEGAVAHDVTIWIAWLDSSHGMLLALLAAGGLLFVIFRSGWERARRAEFYLAAWMAGGLMLHISQAHPTFHQYYLLTVPFLAILGSAAVFAISPEHPYRPVIALVILMAGGLAKAISEEDALTWPKMESVARQVAKVTPPGAGLLADENVYFLLHRIPPSGMELNDSHKLDFPPEKAAWLHLVSENEVIRRMKAGEFASFEECGDETFEDAATENYKQKFNQGTCNVYWDHK
jgi:hypothetical protein